MTQKFVHNNMTSSNDDHRMGQGTHWVQEHNFNMLYDMVGPLNYYGVWKVPRLTFIQEP